jgi:hypothetical protein
MVYGHKGLRKKRVLQHMVIAFRVMITTQLFSLKKEMNPVVTATHTVTFTGWSPVS